MGITGMEVFKGKDFLTLKDFSFEEINALVDLGILLKTKAKNGDETPILKGKTLGMIFQKSSTRTRVSFEVGMAQLGGHALFLNANDLQLGRGESIEDTARVLARYVDSILIRTFAHSDAVTLAEYSSVPVINALTDDYHPTQVLADLITIKEHKGNFKNLKFAYIGDGNNMLNSLMIGCSKMGMDMSIATPEGFEPPSELFNLATSFAKESGGNLSLFKNAEDAVKNADIVYTDTWTSMGQEDEKEFRKSIFKEYQINKNLISLADKRAIVMHCLPAYRDFEISSEVIESTQSVVFDEAENRLHAHKAILAAIM